MKSCRLLLTLGLLVLVPGIYAAQAQTEDSAVISEVPPAPSFSLETEAGDSAELAQKKAALRLVVGFQVTMEQLKLCQAGRPEAGKAMGSFGQRNGNTFGLAMKTIKNQGGLNDEIRKAIEDRVSEAVGRDGLDCQVLIKEVNSGRYDIYKAPQHRDDYLLINPK